MKKRKLVIGLASAGVFSAGFGAAVFPASAELRTITVTLLGGQTVTMQVDAPPGTPVDQLPLPGVTTPVIGVQDNTPAPAPAADPAPATTTAETPAPAETQATPPADPAAVTPTPAPDAAAPAPPDPAADPAPADPATASPLADPAVPSIAAPAQEQATTGEKVRKDPSKDAAAKEPSNVAQTPAPIRRADGTPTPANPTFSVALPGPAPIGVPNFFIDKFRIPPFLLSIYQAAGIEYGIRWEILAAINEIETDYGRNLNVSTAGALGWMQFMPATWKSYGVDANKDGEQDPYNPVDAVFAAARYLKAAGADEDIRKAIFAYNHADWYVDSVLMRARLIGGMPADLVGSLTGLTQGHFPVHAKASYADDLSERAYNRKVAKGKNAAVPVEANTSRRGINIYAAAGSPVIATQDGKVVNIGHTPRLGNFIQLQDAYGNTYTYAQLKKVAQAYPVPKDQKVSKAQVANELDLPKRDPTPTQPASAGKQPAKVAAPASVTSATKDAPAAETAQSASGEVAKERVFANPSRKDAFKHGGEEQLLNQDLSSGSTTFKSYFSEVYGLKRDEVVIKRLKVGSKIIAGTILGRIGKTSGTVAPHVLFEIRPAGRGAPRIDPKPILDGWKLLESTSVYRAAGKNPFFGPDSKSASIGQILLMSKEALQRRVLTNPRIEIYQCGRDDIKAGLIDRRALATMEFLAASGLKPTITSLECGHGFYTASGNVSEHSAGSAIDIAKINGIPILGHQGAGSITEMTIRRLLTLQGTMKPHQIISLMTFDGADNTMSLPDHADHIHIGFQPLYGSDSKLGKQLNSTLKPSQWIKLIDRLGQIDNPTVLTKPSKYSIVVKGIKRASTAHKGE